MHFTAGAVFRSAPGMENLQAFVSLRAFALDWNRGSHGLASRDGRAAVHQYSCPAGCPIAVHLTAALAVREQTKKMHGQLRQAGEAESGRLECRAARLCSQRPSSCRCSSAEKASIAETIFGGLCVRRSRTQSQEGVADVLLGRF